MLEKDKCYKNEIDLIKHKVGASAVATNSSIF